MNQPCCHIDENGVGCEKVAEWEIEDPQRIYENTFACTQHVGSLLTDAPEHRIYPAEQPNK